MRFAASLVVLFALAACTKTGQMSLDATAKQSPQTMVVRVAKQAQTCWFGKKDKAFSRYRMATEVNSFSGKPRFLIVPRDNPGGLPKLVVQAERQSGRTELTVFGPLLTTSDGPRLDSSLRSWARGSTSC